MEIRKVLPFEVASVRSFLERHAESSMFLLSNLDAHGVELGDAPNSGNYKIVERDGSIEAVFCLARRGNLLLQTGGRTDLSSEIVEACADEPLRIQGVVGEWRAAESVWQLVTSDAAFQPEYESCETLYRSALGSSLPTPNAEVGADIVELGPEHAEQWEALRAQFMREEGLPVEGTRESRLKSFRAAAEKHQWWGALRKGALVSMAGLNARYRELGQVGGVYTVPELRRRGLSSAVMRRLLADCASELGLTTMILFTGERNVAARRVYEKVGFEAIGQFALLFGTWLEAG